jgi:hypothetical protein
MNRQIPNHEGHKGEGLVWLVNRQIPNHEWHKGEGLVWLINRQIPNFKARKAWGESPTGLEASEAGRS